MFLKTENLMGTGKQKYSAWILTQAVCCGARVATMTHLYEILTRCLTEQFLADGMKKA